MLPKPKHFKGLFKESMGDMHYSVLTISLFEETGLHVIIIQCVDTLDGGQPVVSMNDLSSVDEITKVAKRRFSESAIKTNTLVRYGSMYFIYMNYPDKLITVDKDVIYLTFNNIMFYLDLTNISKGFRVSAKSMSYFETKVEPSKDVGLNFTALKNLINKCIEEGDSAGATVWANVYNKLGGTGG